MILLFRKYSSLGTTTRNTSAAIASFSETDNATKDDRVAKEIADDRHQSAQECAWDQKRGVRQLDRNHKNSRQCGVDQRNSGLRSHRRGEAVIKISKPRRDPGGAYRIKIVCGLGAAELVSKSAFKRQTGRNHDCDDAQHQDRHGASG